MSGGPSTADDAPPSDVAASLADEEGKRPVEPLSGDLSTADDVAASLADEEGKRPVAGVVTFPRRTTRPLTWPDEEGKRPVLAKREISR